MRTIIKKGLGFILLLSPFIALLIALMNMGNLTLEEAIGGIILPLIIGGLFLAGLKLFYD